MTHILALIPARGGSKGIPRKNIKPFAGYPLIAWSIAAGLQAKSVSRVIVSTDDEEIAAVARQYGADVPFLRPAELAQDRTPDLPTGEAWRFGLGARYDWSQQLAIGLAFEEAGLAGTDAATDAATAPLTKASGTVTTARSTGDGQSRTSL